jgi:hypothetical protein
MFVLILSKNLQKFPVHGDIQKHNYQLPESIITNHLARYHCTVCCRACLQDSVMMIPGHQHLAHLNACVCRYSDAKSNQKQTTETDVKCLWFNAPTSEHLKSGYTVDGVTSKKTHHVMAKVDFLFSIQVIKFSTASNREREQHRGVQSQNGVGTICPRT